MKVEIVQGPPVVRLEADLESAIVLAACGNYAIGPCEPAIQLADALRSLGYTWSISAALTSGGQINTQRLIETIQRT